MDVLNDMFFETPKAVNPFPEEDYNKKGKLRNVRPRVLKKLLKYEFKAYLTPMLIMLAALFALAIALCVLGCFLTPEDFENSSDADPGRMIAWAIGLVIFVWVALAAIFFPLGFATKTYHKQFFTSQGYLTLSIPASPQEHILAKRIAGYIAMIIGSVAAVIAIIIAFLPVLGIMSTDSTPPSDPSAAPVISGWGILYVVLEMLVSPLLLMSVCVGLYFLSTVLSVVLAGAILTIPAHVWEFLLDAGKWISLALKCGAVYLLWLYETQTLRSKINLK